MKTVIVGGVAGGMSAATRLRRLDESMEIVVFERGRYVSFANCGLPYYVGGVISSRDSLLLQTPESLASRFALDVRVRHEVTSIDPARKIVHVTDLRTDTTHEEPYDFVASIHGAGQSVASRGHRAFAAGILDSLNVQGRARLSGDPDRPLTLYEFQDRIARNIEALTNRQQHARGYVPDAIPSQTAILDPQPRSQPKMLRAATP